MQTPFFSVIIPLFNKQAHLRETLASIATQTFDAFEVIVIDDGSTDDSLAIVEAWGDPRLRVLHQANAGPGLARNRGIAEARGAWVAFIDADDLWLPEHLATLFETITAFPAAGLVAAGFVRGETAEAIAADQTGSPVPIDFFDEHHRVWTSAVAVPTPVIQAGGFGPIWPGEDVELWTRLALRHGFAAHPRRTAVYVQRTGGLKDSERFSAPSASILQKPLFVTIDGILKDPAFADRHAAVARYRNTIMLEYTRPSLFNGHTALARAYLQELRRNGGRVPASYRVLAHVPGPLLRRASSFYSACKRGWQHRRS